jgi:hypothetical protein
MRYVGRWPLLPIAGGSGDDEPLPPLTPALARELEELRTYRAQTEPELAARGQKGPLRRGRHAACRPRRRTRHGPSGPSRC